MQATDRSVGDIRGDLSDLAGAARPGIVVDPTALQFDIEGELAVARYRH